LHTANGHKHTQHERKRVGREHLLVRKLKERGERVGMQGEEKEKVKRKKREVQMKKS